MHKLISAFAALSLFACVAASGQDSNSNSYKPAPTLKATFESLDRNADQRLSRTEAGYDRALAKVFAFRDTDGNGFLSRAEYDQVTAAATSPSMASR